MKNQLTFDCAMYKSANYLINNIGIDKAREIMFQSEQKLKQSQNSKAIEVLEQLRRDVWTDQQDDGWLDEKVDLYYLSETIDNQITKLRGGENEI